MKEIKSQKQGQLANQEIKDYHTYLMFVESMKIKALSVKKKRKI
jgi:hypothetical protein